MTADEVKKARKIIGISQRDLAKILEVSPQLVGQWELGGSKPKPDKIEIMQKMMREAAAKMTAEAAEAIAIRSASDERSGLTLTPQSEALISAIAYHLNIWRMTQPMEGSLADSALVLANALTRFLDALPPAEKEKVAAQVGGIDRRVASVLQKFDGQRVRRVVP